MWIKVKCYTDPQKPLQEQLGLPHFFIHLTSFLGGGQGQVTGSPVHALVGGRHSAFQTGCHLSGYTSPLTLP